MHYIPFQAVDAFAEGDHIRSGILLEKVCHSISWPFGQHGFCLSINGDQLLDTYNASCINFWQF